MDDLDGIPDFLKLTAEERRKSWEEHPPVDPPLFLKTVQTVDPATAALRAKIEADNAAQETRHGGLRKDAGAGPSPKVAKVRRGGKKRVIHRRCNNST